MEHRFWGSGTWLSYDMFMIFGGLRTLVFASFSGRFWKPFWFVLVYPFRALGIQKVTNMSSEMDAKMGIGKSRFQGRTTAKNSSKLVARRGYPPPPRAGMTTGPLLSHFSLPFARLRFLSFSFASLRDFCARPKDPKTCQCRLCGLPFYRFVCERATLGNCMF